MTINCKGKLIDLSIPKVMGILNLTPDSFYDGGKYKNDNEILSQVYMMLKNEATFIDIGAYSSRPNAEHISESQELKRLLPIIALIVEEFPDMVISIDTFRSNVAKKSIEAGGSIINDISAGQLDQNMMLTVAELKVPYVMMHMKGTPQNMQQLANYDYLLKDILFYFSNSFYIEFLSGNYYSCISRMHSSIFNMFRDCIYFELSILSHSVYFYFFGSDFKL